ncbi:MAG: Uncharacterized protein Greene07147_479 [Parcubacteria group bacterium Greene0714_7]|nr:MAG: Uncharacterized protein Greene07147_479 [Parcubacteria group bacterium Greene0714_7]
MGKRGPKPRRKKPVEWSSNLAYAIGLIATDGSLSKNGRHIELTSKDRGQLQTFMRCLDIEVKIGIKKGYADKTANRVQFGDVVFYDFLLEIGLTPNKTKTIGALDIPDKYFFDFLRGHHDGDGSFHSYWDKRWKSSFMFYLIFVSASKEHVDWLRSKLERFLDVRGHITHGRTATVYQLKYAKAESLKIIKNMYYSNTVPCLKRKRVKIFKALRRAGNLTKFAQVLKLVDISP